MAVYKRPRTNWMSILSCEYRDMSVAWCTGDATLGRQLWSCVHSFASSKMTMYMISDRSVFLQYECIHILLAYMYSIPCSICILSLSLLLSDNSSDQLMLFVLLYPTLNKSYVMVCWIPPIKIKSILFKSVWSILQSTPYYKSIASRGLLIL